MECIQKFTSLDSRDYASSISLCDVHKPQWIFEHPVYSSWLESTKSCVLQLRGKAGSGLSVLGTFLSTSLRTDKPDSTVIYFSFDPQDSRQCSASAMFASLTHQLLFSDPSCSTYVLHLYNLITEKFSWDVENLWVFFRSTLLCPRHRRTTICIIGAVDKCDPLSRRFLVELLSLANSENSGLKFIISNAHNVFAHLPLPLTIDLDLEDGIRSDIERIITSEVASLTETKPSFHGFDDALRQEILGSNPTFLEATLMLKLLKTIQFRSTPASVQAVLKSIPKSLPELHRFCLLRNFGAGFSWARSALSWIAHAFRPLKVPELAIALAIKSEAQQFSIAEDEISQDLIGDLKQAFGSFIRIHNNEVLLTYESAKDFLLSSQCDWDLHSEGDRYGGHARLANTCLDYLSHVGLQSEISTGDRSESHMLPARQSSLLVYAAQYWHMHYRLVKDKSTISAKAFDFLGKLGPDLLFLHVNWCSTEEKQTNQNITYNKRLLIAAELGLNDIVLASLDHSPCSESDQSTVLSIASQSGDNDFVQQLLERNINVGRALHLAAQSGHLDVVCRLLDAGADVKALDDTESTPLHLASRNGYQRVVVELLSRGSDIEAIDTNHSSSLHVAAEFGHVEVMQTLIEARSNLSRVDAQGLTPLHLATKSGQLRAISLLLNAGADKDAIDNESWTALHHAAASGLVEVVQLLIRSGAQINMTCRKGNTALHLASRGGHLRTVLELLNAKADVEVVASDNGTPLHVAALKGFLDIISSILHAGADPNTIDGRGRIPLHLAASSGQVKLVQMLIRADSHRDAIDEDGLAPLHLAVENGHLGAVEALIKEKASVNIVSSTGFTPLSIAARRGDLKIVEELLAAEAQVQGNFSTSPLHVAAKCGNTDVIRLLVTNHADPEAVDSNQRTPLHLAAKLGKQQAVRELLATGAYPDPADENEATPLLLATASRHTEIVRILIRAGADPTESDGDGSTALHLAALNGDLEAADLLLEHNLDIRAPNNRGQIPLHIAAQQGHAEMIQKLLDAKPRFRQLKATDSQGRTPLHLATWSGHVEAAKSLLDNGANLEAASSEGMTPLHLAADRGHLEMVRLLLEKGAAPNAVDEQKRRPLQIAAQQGHQGVMKLLLEKSDIDVIDDDKNTLLHSASQGGLTEAVKYLLERGVDANAMNDEGQTPLFLAAANGHNDVVKILVESRADPNTLDDDGKAPLHVAIKNGYLDLVNYLLDNGADKNASERWPLMYTAAYFGRIKIVEEFVKRSIDMNIRGPNDWTPLHAAFDNAAIVRILLEKGAEVDAVESSGRTPLYLAIANYESGTVKVLLENKANPLKQCENGSTALHRAIDDRNREAFELMADFLEANPAIDLVSDLKDQHGRTPLMAAIKTNQTNVVKFLLERTNVEVEQRNERGQTLLNVAVEVGNDEIIEMLLEKGADLDSQGDLILRLASARGRVSLVQRLIDEGADPYETDEHGWTAALFASTTNQNEILSIFQGVHNRDATRVTRVARPTSFSETDKSILLKVSEDNMIIEYTGARGVGSARADHPISPQDETFYFEIEVISEGSSGYVSHMGFGIRP